MATITSLAFRITSTYSDRGTAEARRDLAALQAQMAATDREHKKLQDGLSTSRWQAWALAISAAGPALVPVAQGLIAVAGATAVWAGAAAAAGGVWGIALKGAINQLTVGNAGLLTMSKNLATHKAILSTLTPGTAAYSRELKQVNQIQSQYNAALAKADPAQRAFVSSFTSMQTAWQKFIADTRGDTLGVAAKFMDALAGSFAKFEPLVRAVTPLAMGLATAFQRWVNVRLDSWVNYLRQYGVPALQQMITIGKNVAGTLGDAFRAFGPLALQVGDAITRASAAMKNWADGGGFQRFLENVAQNGPAIKEFFRNLGDALANVGRAFGILGPAALNVTNIMLQLIAAMPPPLLAAIIEAWVLMRAAMVAMLIVNAVTRAFQVFQAVLLACRFAALALDVSLAPFLITAGLIVAVVVMLGVVIYLLVTRWKEFSTYMSSSFMSAVNATWSGLKQFGSWISTGFSHAWDGVKVAWSAIWSGLQTAANATWSGMKTAWNATSSGFTTAWNASSSALKTAWNAVWNGLKAAGDAIWSGIKSAWSATVSGLTTAWNASSAGLKAAWNAVWNGLKTAGDAIWSGLRTAWNATASGFMTAWNASSAGLRTAWNATWNALKAAGEAIWNAMKTAWGAVASAFSTAWTTSSNALRASWTAVWNGIKTAGEAVWNAMKSAWSAFLGALKTAWDTTSNAIKASWSTVWNGIKTVGTTVWNAIKAAWQTLLNSMKAAWDTASNAMKASWNTVWNAIKTAAQNVWNAMKNAWQTFLNAMKTAWTTFSNAMKASWNTIWNAIKTATQAIWNALKTAWQNFLNAMKSAWTAFSNAMKSSWSAVWNAIKSATQAIWNAIKSAWQALLNSMKSIWDAASSALKSSWSAMWNAIKSTAQTVWNAIRSGFSSFATGVENTLSGLVNKAKSIWSQIVNVFKTPVNAVIGIWDTVAGAVGLPKISKLANGGPVNGAGGKRDDRIPAMLSNGEYVVNADAVNYYGLNKIHALNKRETPRLAEGGFVGNVPRFAGGGLVGGILPPIPDPIKKVVGAAKDVLTGAGTLAGDVMDKLKSVAATAVFDIAKPVLDKVISAIPHPVPGIATPAGNVPYAAAKKIEEGMLNKLKSTQEAAKAAAAAIGGSIPTGQHKAIIDAALAKAGIPQSQWPMWEAGLNTLITRESGWNPNAINLTDSNAMAGHPSQGLMQTIPSTFAAYSLGGSITDPVSNIVAGIRYIVARYGSISNVQQANANLPPKGYFNGTSGAASGWHMVGEHGPEMVQFRGGEKVWSNKETHQMFGHRGGHGDVHIEMPIHVHGNLDHGAVQKLDNEVLPKLRVMLAKKTGCN